MLQRLVLYKDAGHHNGLGGTVESGLRLQDSEGEP
jgi:hypothetical protein